MISPTQLLIKYLGIAPEGTEVAEQPGRCVMCAGDYQAGDIIEPFSPASSFTEYSDLQHPAGTHICSACKATWTKEWMQNYTKSVVCDGYLYPFFSNDAVTHFLLNPPEPPYLMFISTQQLGHVVWKVPVNLSRDLMMVRYNDKVLKIRRGHLLDSVDAVKTLSDLLIQWESDQEAKTGKVAKKPRKAGFINPLTLDRSLENPAHGQLKSGVLNKIGDDPAGRAAIEILQCATLGETWALAHVLFPKIPGKPEPKLVRPGK